MIFLNKLNRLLELYTFGLRYLLRPKNWWPFFVYFLLQLILLLILVNFANRYIYSWLEPVIGLLIGSEQAGAFSHYPGLYLFLPFIFQILKLIPGVIFEAVAVGLTVVLFIESYHGTSETGYRYSDVYSRWLQLVLTWVPITAILFAINWFAPQILKPLLVGSPRRMMIFEIGLPLFTVFVYALFVYAVPAVIVYRINFIAALGKSLKLFVRQPLFTIFLTLIANVIPAVLYYLVGKSNVIVADFAPELVSYLLFVTIIIDMIIYIIFIGALTRFLIEEKE
jgi:hypothetical protein